MPFALAAGQEVRVWASPVLLCWDEHATAPDLCHPPRCHLIAGVGRRKGKGQGQAGMQCAENATVPVSHGRSVALKFASRDRCSYEYSPFAAVTRVAFRHSHVNPTNPKQQTADRTEFHFIFHSLKAGRIRSKPEDNFKTLLWSRSDPLGTAGHGSSDHPLYKSLTGCFVMCAYLFPLAVALRHIIDVCFGMRAILNRSRRKNRGQWVIYISRFAAQNTSRCFTKWSKIK